MKAVVYKGPRQLAVEDIPMPEVLPGYALIKVKASGICGSDIHGYLGTTGRRNPGVVMGHEFSGEVVEVAPDVTDFVPGDRVVVEPTINCEKCRFCKAGRTQYCTDKGFLGVFSVNGGFAEYVSVPARLLFRLPDDMSFEEGALIEPTAVAKCGVEMVADYTGKTVVIVGAGTIGLLVLSVLKSKNPACIIVTDLSENRLKAAKELGADYVLNPKNCDVIAEVMNLTDGIGADVSIECVGLGKSVDTAMSCLHKEGAAVWIGNSAKEITLDMQRVVTGGLSVYGTYTYSHEDFGKTLYSYKEMGIPTERIISRTLTPEEAPEVIEDLANGNDSVIKTVIVF